ncbi:hypothetical protein R1flu_013530 [Riccia fluitans]|uniref:Uncharacterized protein n=1 Tax=Riccia fluitans TaxID=41844 RepID=A0ABD1YEN0_9MARC
MCRTFVGALRPDETTADQLTCSWCSRKLQRIRGRRKAPNQGSGTPPLVSPAGSVEVLGLREDTPSRNASAGVKWPQGPSASPISTVCSWLRVPMCCYRWDLRLPEPPIPREVLLNSAPGYDRDGANSILVARSKAARHDWGLRSGGLGWYNSFAG